MTLPLRAHTTRPQPRSNGGTSAHVAMQTKQERLPLLKTELENPPHEIIGLLWMALSALFFGVSGLLVRYVTAYGGLPASSVVLVRGLIQTVLMLGAISVAPDGRDVFRNTPKLWGLLALHGCSGAIGILALFGSFKLLDLSVASAIYYTSKCHTSHQHTRH